MGIGVGVYPQINLKLDPIMILAIQHRKYQKSDNIIYYYNMRIEFLDSSKCSSSLNSKVTQQ